MNILVVFIFLVSNTASMDVQEYETSLINLMNEDWIKSQQTEYSASGQCPPLECQPNEKKDISGDCPKCVCRNGFVIVDGNCTAVKEFGGGIVLDVDYYENNATLIAYKTIYAIYNATTSFINVTILNTAQGSIVADYILQYEDDDSVTEETVRNAFDDVCNCIDNSTIANDTAVNCSRSCVQVIDTKLLCANGSSWYGYCDSDTTTCEGTKYGNVSCNCTGYYTTLNSSECYDDCGANDVNCNNQGNCSRLQSGDRVCQCDPQYEGESCERNAPYCDKNSQCNSPFGTCDGTSNRCNCMWGFQGDYCYQPWMFVLTIVASGLGLIIIVLIIVMVCYKRKTKKTGKHTVDEPLDELNPFSEFQPGMMRAQLPSYLTSSVTDPMPATRQSADQGPSTSTFNQARRDSDGDPGGYTNYGYASVDKAKRSSSKRSSPSSPPARDYF